MTTEKYVIFCHFPVPSRKNTSFSVIYRYLAEKIRHFLSFTGGLHGVLSQMFGVIGPLKPTRKAIGMLKWNIETFSVHSYAYLLSENSVHRIYIVYIKIYKVQKIIFAENCWIYIYMGTRNTVRNTISALRYTKSGLNFNMKVSYSKIFSTSKKTFPIVT